MIIVLCRVRLQKKSTVASELEFIKILNVEILNIDLQDAILALGKIRLIAVEDTVGDIITELSHPNPRLMPELQGLILKYQAFPHFGFVGSVYIGICSFYTIIIRLKNHRLNEYIILDKVKRQSTSALTFLTICG